MRYIKVLLLVLLFFISMLFFFQNQETLGRDMALKLDLMFLFPVKSIALPTSFVLLAGFLLGALFAVAFLLWDKLALSAKLMKAQWKVRNLEKEVARNVAMSSSVATPAEAKAKFPQMAARVKDDITAPDPDKHG
jgi:ATP adenylyltransferase